MKAEGEETVFFKALKENNPQPRILYPVKISVINESEIKTLSDEGTRREFIVRPLLKEMLKEVLKTKGKWYKKETWKILNKGKAK